MLMMRHYKVPIGAIKLENDKKLRFIKIVENHDIFLSCYHSIYKHDCFCKLK